MKSPTGRLSSQGPNMQGLNPKTEEVDQLRAAFTYHGTVTGRFDAKDPAESNPPRNMELQPGARPMSKGTGEMTEKPTEKCDCPVCRSMAALAPDLTKDHVPYMLAQLFLKFGMTREEGLAAMDKADDMLTGQAMGMFGVTVMSFDDLDEFLAAALGDDPEKPPRQN